jgi:TetR/AcrR family transcriptional repressor of mexJK operon
VDVAYSSDSLRLFRLMIAEQGAFPELGKRAYRTGVAPFIARVAHYLATAVSPPGIRFEDVDGSARLLLDLVLGDEHLRCLLGVKSGISAREKTRLVGRIVPIYLRAHREPP